ncbi:hypothetical protein [Shouchella shacheensis]|nr:hypothetical protein [Shouchella shacheensis]
MIELLIPGAATLIGAFLGAWLSGRKTLESVKQQIDYQEKLRKKKKMIHC